MKNFIFFVLCFLIVNPALAKEKPVVVVREDFDSEFRANVENLLCDLPQPTKRPAIVYIRENGKCVAKIRL